MPFTITMPKLSPTMEEGVIARWLKQEGDLVKAGDAFIEIATDKATVEHAALDAGYLRKILIAAKGTAVVNQPIAVFTVKADESIEGYIPEGVLPKTPEPAVASTPALAPRDVVPQAVPLGSQSIFKPEPPLPYTTITPTSSTPRASPLAKKLARDKGIDLTTVRGTGPRGRVVSRDLDLGQPDLPVTFGRQEVPSVAPGSFEEESLTPMRKAIAQRLQASKSTIPHFYVSMDILCDPLMAIRDQLKELGLRVSVNDCIVRATALALREHPVINSGFDSQRQQIVRFKTVDVAIAVSIDDGLITPIVRHADYKHLGELSMEIKHLARLAKEGKLEREQFTGGSFTISNLGMYGVSDFVAVINPPQAAILAIGSVLEHPVVNQGQVRVGHTMRLTLSADHRVIDGAAAALFLQTVRKFLTQPAGLLL